MSRHWGRALTRPGSLLARLLPPDSRDWGRGWLAELDSVERPGEAVRWMLGGGRVLARGWIREEEALMKTVLTTLSLLNALAGFALLGLYLTGALGGDSQPAVVGLLGAGMLIQGTYTLLYLAGVLDRLRPWSTRTLLAGQTAALVVGLVGLASSAVYNVNPVNGDHEYGPLAGGALIAINAAVTLWIFVRPPSVEPSSTG